MSMTLAGCQEVEEFAELKKAKTITLHRLEAKSQEATEGLRIIADRQVESSVILDGSEKKQLVKALVDKANYQPVSRRCLMAPTYALEADGKVIAFFDPEFCPRIQYTGKVGEIEFDIKAENSLLEVLKNIYASR